MYLEYINIHGFKSFANKSVLDFRPAHNKNQVGITAIVGPNGSGKSNVVDAIRWALGEQSTKQLRGKKSGDVIFAGSDKKSRNSRAEVSIRLNNADRKIDLDYAEIELTRQLFRSGESDYLINGQKSRLQDIHYLLAQANIGQKSYTVIGQGMIDTVLNSTPQQRKEFFDEAAGVRQYQIKKDQAANKLASSKDNLKQGEIQLQEITPRLRSLARQMKRLEQREEIIESLENSLNQYYSYHWNNITWNLKKYLDTKIELEKQKNEYQANLDKLQIHMQELASVSSEGSSEFEDLQNTYSKLLTEKNNLTRNLAEWQGKQNNKWLASGQHSLTLYQSQLNNLNDEIKQTKEELTRNYQIIKSSQEQAKLLTQNYSKIISEIKRIQDNIFSKLTPASGNLADTIIIVKNEINSIINKLNNLFDDIKNEKSSFAELDNKFSEYLAKIQEHLNILPADNSSTKLSDWHEKIDKLDEEKSKLDENILEIKGQLKYLEEKNKSLSNTISIKEEQKSKLEIELKKIKNSVTSDQEQDQIETNVDELSQKIKQLEEKLTDINEKLSSYNQNEELKKKQIFSEQQEALELQKELNTIHQKLTDSEIQLARWQTKKEDLKHSVSQDFEKTWGELTEVWKNNPTESDIDLEKLENQIQQLKNKRDLLGSIDDETKKEYEEISERHTWLEQQTTDLNKAIISLEEIIKDLDKKIEEQFTSNIKAINNKFSDYFSMLFNGGKAELKIRKDELVASAENPDEDNDEGDEEQIEQEIKPKQKDAIVGIDIMATPPGKRLQNISVLSGGEKALTSIALICAIIANNTSPFVVLDEVDAALDEANSLRFAQILEELSKKTQFIVVTHNRATMEKAQLLYGVTMGDDGVSKLLSIKLEEGKQYTNR